ncbi:hypothetical protein ONS95_010484 [Cadophora gregata]|uniref:uncharacterized protein n=1 Tax=Cadophora gregata TaxID=51156 RepID=UPI0026DAFAC0|nr:uncharacterized protein ONS95_010484 [Cadophora gregata]KAK0122231.1 hypothetical protein ONS95_010484 [Cadophora gregata]KAK0127707.1 hypothetical protein ONS96_007225 [Cadophora gregata f. sp. sojae]
MFSLVRTIQLASLLAIPAACHPSHGHHSSNSSYIKSLPKYAQSLMTESMDWLDGYYDPSAGYLFDIGSASALRHETRSSAWYAVGLLARNEGKDVEYAMDIITNVIAGQFKDPKDQWYGNYQQEPEEPTVGTSVYPAKIYNSWDPNWRGFISTAFIVGLEEFGHLITPNVTTLLLESLYNATKGDEYRVGGVDSDNLYPAYTNPSIMRAFAAGWTGRRLNESNMTISGENYANEILDLFNRADTLSEFNSGTYTGVSLWALSLWAKYLPDDSVMKQNGARMMKKTWEAVGELWHPDLKNIAGPWDRSYGFDMNRYLSLMALHFWSIIGKENSSLIEKVPTLSHVADFGWGPLFAILAEFQNSIIPEDVVERLTKFSGEHTFTSSAFSPPFDIYPRNITSWLAPNISIGAETFNETVIGGPAINPNTFNPAVIQWNTGSEIGFINLRATESYVTAVATPYTLNITYPLGNASSVFSFVVSAFKEKTDVSTWEDVQGLSVHVSGNVNSTYAVGWAGSYGGAYKPVNDFEFWNFTYTMPVGFEGVPSLLLELEFK